MDSTRPPLSGASTARAELPLRVQVPLVHAVIESVAAAASCPVLHLKGPVLAHQLEVDRPPSTDVDVLVAPSRRPDLVAALGRHGWRVAAPVGADRAGEHHAVVLVHPRWTCAVDLHDRFPGVEMPAEEAFGHLWSRRSSVRVAGVEVHAPSRPDHALLLLLHAARGQGRRSAERDIALIRAGLGAEETAALAAATEALRANAAMGAVVPGLVRGGSGGAAVHWWLRSRRSDGASLWAGRFLAARGLRARWAVARAAIFPSTSIPSRWRRWARGARELPSTLRAVRTARSELDRLATTQQYGVVPAAPTVRPAAVHTSPRELVAHVEDDGVLWAAALPAGPACRLDGTGRLVWEAARGGAAAEEVVETVAQTVGLPAGEIGPDVLAFLDLLAELGLFQQVRGPGVRNSRPASPS